MRFLPRSFYQQKRNFAAQRVVDPPLQKPNHFYRASTFRPASAEPTVVQDTTFPELKSLIGEHRLATGVENRAYQSFQQDVNLPIESVKIEDCIIRKSANTRQRRETNPLQRNTFKEDLYPTHPHNFTPLRGEITQPGFSALDRAIRDIPWESRFELCKRKVTPQYASEVRGTPRKEHQEGMVEGVRIRPVFNPYVELTSQKRYVLDNWPSRDWRQFDSEGAFRVRGGRKKYTLPRDIAPTKDELGEMHPPRLSGRYKADIEKQFYAHNLPWIWANNFYTPNQHFMDRTPRGPKRWYKKEFRKIRIADAMRKMPELVEEYRKERRAAKRLSWFEKSMVDLMGNAITGPFIRKQELPKF